MLHNLYLFVSFSVHELLNSRFSLAWLSFWFGSRELNSVPFFLNFPWFLGGVSLFIAWQIGRDIGYANVPIRPQSSIYISGDGVLE